MDGLRNNKEILRPASGGTQDDNSPASSIGEKMGTVPPQHNGYFVMLSEAKHLINVIAT